MVVAVAVAVTAVGTMTEEGEGVNLAPRKEASMSERLRGDLGDTGIGGGEELDAIGECGGD